MAIHLIRHGHAGSRSAWTGEDRARPLSGKGQAQADGLVALLEGEPVGAIRSSPYARCTQTVAPLAGARGLEVVEEPTLAEGACVDDVVDLLLALAPQDPVLCSHGDVIPAVLRRLLAEGMRADVGALSKKGSTWRLEVADGRIARGAYLPPPSR